MSDSLAEALGGLSGGDLTVKLLELLDFVVPGEWENATTMAEVVAAETGESHPEVVRRVTERAEALFASGSSYSTALTLFEAVDTIDRLASATAVASKVGGLFGSLNFLEDFTPKPETTQSIDAAIKLVVELVTFGMLRGVPKDASFEQIADFVIALQDYAKSDVMRLSAWVIVDGLMPLGPNFMGRIIASIEEVADSALLDNALFESVSSHILGDGIEGKRGFILEALRATSAWVEQFVTERELTRERILEQMSRIVTVSADSLDYVAAGLDASTSYMAHTGTQSVAREAVRAAYAELREQAWREWVDAL